MKKLFVLPLFIGVIALSSCSGSVLSLDDAKQRLENVISLAIENGKYIGGQFLTRESTRSNIIYDLEAAVVETHNVVANYYFDFTNNYFRLDTVQTDVFVNSDSDTQKKVIEIDYYLYVLDNDIVNTTLTYVNGVAADKSVIIQEVNDLSMQNFRRIMDGYYTEYIDEFETSVFLTAEALDFKERETPNFEVELSTYGSRSLMLFSKDLVENKNVYIDFRYNQLKRFESFDRNTHELITESFNYGSFYRSYAY
jgi:hypothetical protein